MQRHHGPVHRSFRLQYRVNSTLQPHRDVAVTCASHAQDISVALLAIFTRSAIATAASLNRWREISMVRQRIIRVIRPLLQWHAVYMGMSGSLKAYQCVSQFEVDWLIISVIFSSLYPGRTGIHKTSEIYQSFHTWQRRLQEVWLSNLCHKKTTGKRLEFKLTHEFFSPKLIFAVFIL